MSSPRTSISQPSFSAPPSDEARGQRFALSLVEEFATEEGALQAKNREFFGPWFRARIPADETEAFQQGAWGIFHTVSAA